MFSFQFMADKDSLRNADGEEHDEATEQLLPRAFELARHEVASPAEFGGLVSGIAFLQHVTAQYLPAVAKLPEFIAPAPEFGHVPVPRPVRHGFQSFHAVPVYLPDIRLTDLGRDSPAPSQSHALGCSLRPQVDVMVVVDLSLPVDAAERAVKVGNAAYGKFLVRHGTARYSVPV